MTGSPQQHDWPAHRHRLRVILIAGPKDTVYQQRQLFLSHDQDVVDRDLVVLAVGCQGGRRKDVDPVDTLAAKYGLAGKEFQILLIGKDGEVKERRTSPVEPREFFDCIDAMPLRIREVRETRQED